MNPVTPVRGRIRYRTWVKVVPLRGPGLLGHIEEISVDGLGVEHDRPVETGQECQVYFMLPVAGRQNVVQARCRVADCRAAEAGDRYHVGLDFLEFISDPVGTPVLIEAFVRQVELKS